MCLTVRYYNILYTIEIYDCDNDVQVNDYQKR